MNDTSRINQWIKSHGDLALDLVRIYLGVGLIVKAVYFMTHTDYFMQLMEQAGWAWFTPAAISHYVIGAHLVGGFFLTLGLMTRIAAAVQLPILIGAVFLFHLPKMAMSMAERQNLELSGLVLFLLFVISLYGAGRFSVDHWLAKKWSPDLLRPSRTEPGRPS